MRWGGPAGGRAERRRYGRGSDPVRRDDRRDRGHDDGRCNVHIDSGRLYVEDREELAELASKELRCRKSEGNAQSRAERGYYHGLSEYQEGEVRSVEAEGLQRPEEHTSELQ